MAQLDQSFEGQILYLCISPGNERGLVFPQELPLGYFSPGKLVAIREESRSTQQVRMRAYLGEQLLQVNVELNWKIRQALAVVAEVGETFSFQLVKVDYRFNQYVGHATAIGRLIGQFWRLVPLNEERLEAICRDRGFYFCGVSAGREG